MFKVGFVYLGAVGGPEEVVHHSLTQRKPECQGSRKLPAVNPAAVGLDGKGIDFELLLQESGGGASEAQEVVSCHGGVAGVFFAGKGPDGGACVPLFQTVAGNLVEQPVFFFLFHSL